MVRYVCSIYTGSEKIDACKKWQWFNSICLIYCLVFLSIIYQFKNNKIVHIKADHSILVLKSHRKNKLKIRYATPRPMRTPTEAQRPTSKFIWSIFELPTWSTSLYTKAEKLYLIGLRYWIQPIQADKFPVFLKNPENRKKGKRIMGVKVLTDLLSVTIVPTIKPKDIPLKQARYEIR